jgi:hypothetical protein
VKKAVEVPPMITIALVMAGGWAIKAFIDAFFSKAGEAAWEALRKRIPRLLRRAKEEQGLAPEAFLVFRFVSPPGAQYRCVEVVVPNPSEEDIQAFRDIASAGVGEIVEALVRDRPDAIHFTFDYSDGRLRLKFGIRDDAAPLHPDSATDPTGLSDEVQHEADVDAGMGVSISGTASRQRQHPEAGKD